MGPIYATRTEMPTTKVMNSETMLTTITQREFVQELSKRKMVPELNRIIYELEFYHGVSIHDVRNAKIILEIVKKNIQNGKFRARTFEEFREEKPFLSASLYRSMYKAFINGAYRL